MRALSFGFVFGVIAMCSMFGCGDDGGSEDTAVETAPDMNEAEVLAEVEPIEETSPGETVETSAETVETTPEVEVEIEAEVVVAPRTERLRFVSEGAALANTKVRVTRADGTFDEPTTDADGRLVIADIVGPLTLVCETEISDARTAHALVGYEEADFAALRVDGEAVVVIAPEVPIVAHFYPGDEVITARVTGIVGTRDVVISTNADEATPQPNNNVTNDALALVIVPGQGPMHAVARYVRDEGPPLRRAWAVASWEPFDVPVEEYVIDFSAPMLTASATTSVPMPSFADELADATVTFIADWDGPIELSAAEVTAGTDAWTVALEWPNPFGPTAYRTKATVYQGFTWSTWVYETGAPAATITTPFIEPPTFVVEPTSLATLEASPPELTQALPNTRATVALYDAFAVFGFISYGQNVTRLDVPKRPGGDPIVKAGVAPVVYRLTIEEPGEHARGARRSVSVGL